MTKGGRVQLYRVIPFLLLSITIIISSNRNRNYHYGHYRPSLYSAMACVLWSSVTMLHSCIPGRNIPLYMEMKRRMLEFAWFLWEETHSEKICDDEEYLLEIESIDVNNMNLMSADFELNVTSNDPAVKMIHTHRSPRNRRKIIVINIVTHT